MKCNHKIRKRVKFLDHVFEGQAIKRGNPYYARSLTSSSLEIDSFDFEVKSSDTTLAQFIRNTPLTYNHDDVQMGMLDLFPTWETVLSEGKELAADRIISKDGQLYRVVQAVTPIESQPPDGEGMLAIYRPINPEHAGAADDPIPWVYGMDCHAGKYYSYEGAVYMVAEGGDMIPCTWPPDSGIWQWVKVDGE